MVAILIISAVITPPILWCLLVLNITDQYVEMDDKLILTETKTEAQNAVLKETFMHPFFWVWFLYASIMIFATVCAYDIFGMGEWWNSW